MWAPPPAAIGTEWPDDAFAEIAAHVPGFAGFEMAGDTLVLRLVDPRRSVDAEAEVRRLPDGRTGAAAARRVAVRTARYDAGALRTWKWRLRAAPPPRATLWMIEGARNRIVVGFADSADFRAGRRALRRLRIPRGAVALVIATHQDF